MFANSRLVILKKFVLGFFLLALVNVHGPAHSTTIFEVNAFSGFGSTGSAIVGQPFSVEVDDNDTAWTVDSVTFPWVEYTLNDTISFDAPIIGLQDPVSINMRVITGASPLFSLFIIGPDIFIESEMHDVSLLGSLDPVPLVSDIFATLRIDSASGFLPRGTATFSGGGGGAVLDVVASAVSEPGTLAIFLGFAGFMISTRRKRAA